jgi:predicted Zn-dependent protease with MMP-like domain
MDLPRFEELVVRAVDRLPEEIREYLDNVDIVVEDFPSPKQVNKSGTKRGYILLGLYEGIPRTERGSHHGMVVPDKISIFRKNIESICHTDGEIVREIGRVVRHEIAHHFGIGDARLKEIEQDKD